MGRGNHFQVILILFQVHMLGGALFFSRRLFTCDITAFFLCFLQKKLGGKGGLGQKFVKRHNGIPIRNNYTRFHEATSIGRGKNFFFVYFSKKNENLGGKGGLGQ